MPPLAFALGLFGLMALRAVSNEASTAEVLAYGLFLAAYVVLPGWLAYRLLGAPDDDWLMALGMGWMLGHVIQLGSYLALKCVGASGLYAYFPIVLLPLAALGLGRARPSAQRAPPRPGHVVLLFGILALAVGRTPILPYWWLAGWPDFLFHVGNAAELKHHWPLSDPRLAGEALNYHFFSYAFPAGASQVTGIPVAALMQRLAASALPVLLGLQVFNAGRAYGRSAAAGLLGAALVVLHADVAATLLPLLGLGKFSGGFNSYLDVGIYGSLSTALGLASFASLAIALRRWLTGARPDPRSLGLAAALAAAASGVKGSVMPVVLAALGGLLAWTGLVRRRPSGRALAATLLLGLAAAPMTLYLALGPGSYASGMFVIEPLQAMSSSAFYKEIAARLPAPDAWLTPLVAPLWMLGYLGVGALAGLFLLWRERRRLDDAQRWLALVFAAGLAPSLLLTAPGHSQIFFLYNGQLALTVLGGAWLASQARPRTRRGVVLALALLVLALPMLGGAAWEIGARVERDWSFRPRAAVLEADYAEGLRWIRETTAPTDLFVTQHGFILVSAFGERRVFYETDYFTAAAHARRAPGNRYGSRTRKKETEPFAGRERAFRRFLSGPGLEDVRALRAFASDAGESYLVVDDVTTLVGIGWGHYRVQAPPRPDRFEANPLLLPVFSNRALRIYRVEDGGPPARSSAPTAGARR